MVTENVPTSGYEISAPGNERTFSNASGWRIGDGYVLTAGHVVYEWDRVSSSNPYFKTVYAGSLVYDWRGYTAGLRTQTIATPSVSNETIEGQPSVYVNDMVLVGGQGGQVTSTSEGLVTFLKSSDMNAATINGALKTSTTITLYGSTTGSTPGNTDVSSAPAGSFFFSSPTQKGDSGAAYILSYGDKSFVLGVQSGITQTAPVKSLANYFNRADWTSLSNKVTAGLVGDLSVSEPTNLLVGTSAADSAVDLTGSKRADIILGREGNDYLSGGDNNTTSWANDQLYGGAGNDVLSHGTGFDFFHGGDRRLLSSDPANLAGDGNDAVNYNTATTVDASKGVKIIVDNVATNSTWSSNLDFSHATFVTDLGRQHDTDTLISIETINASTARDVLVINAFDPARLANSSGLGGFKIANLGTDTSGDLVDLRHFSDGAVVDLSGSTGSISGVSTPSLKVYVTGAEQVVGSASNDTITGSGAADTLAGGAGDDSINGGSGADILVADGGADTITGGAGGDKFWIELGTQADSVTIVDAETGDSLFWHGYQLTGGALTVIEHEGNPNSENHNDWFINHLDKNNIGAIYLYNDVAETCRINLPGGEYVLLNNFQNGDCGIQLTGGNASQFSSMLNNHQDKQLAAATAGLPHSNVADNGALDFMDMFSHLTGYQNSVSNYGSNPVPYDFLI